MSTLIKIDPICGMRVEPEYTGLTYTFAGWTYVFCSQDCLDKFEHAPEACVTYLAHSRSAHVGHRCCYQRASVPPFAGSGVTL